MIIALYNWYIWNDIIAYSYLYIYNIIIRMFICCLMKYQIYRYYLVYYDIILQQGKFDKIKISLKHKSFDIFEMI